MKTILRLFLALLSPCLANAQSLPGNISTENTVLAGPISGSGAPTARTLVQADIPILAQSAAFFFAWEHHSIPSYCKCFHYW